MAAGAAALPYDTPEVRALLEHVRDYAIFVVDARGHVVTWNAGARAIKGYVEREIIGEHIGRFYTPEDRVAGLPQRLLELAARDGRVESEGWRVRKDGSRFWADVVITALKDDRSAVVGFLKVTRDLTERRTAEAALRQTEESLAATLYSIGDAVISTDAGARVTRLNPVAERLTGWPEAEAVGRPIAEVFQIINEETRKPAFNPITRILAEGVVVGLANHTALISRDGSERPIADSGAPIRGVDGAVQGAVLVFRDASQERTAEKALRESEQKLRLMITSVPDYAFYMLDPNGVVANWNSGAERLTGYRSDEIVGSHVSRLYAPDDIAAGNPALEMEAALRDGRFSDESWRIRKDGSRFWASVLTVALRDDSGTLVGFAKVTRDRSERRQAEQQLARQAAQQAAVAELGLFAIASRDLQPVLESAAAVVTRMLGTDLAQVLELQPGGQLLVRAGVGWNEGIVGHASVPATEHSFAGSVFSAGTPLVIENLADDQRIVNTELLAAHGVVSGLAVVIPVAGESSRFGVFGTYSRRSMSFSADDVTFFQAVANVVASAVARARAEQQVRAVEKVAAEEKEKSTRAQEAVRERDIFLAVTTHELRTPLTALQLTLQGLAQKIHQNAEALSNSSYVEQRFKAALRQTSRLVELVERLLDVSRIAAGSLQVNRTPVDLQNLVREVVTDFQVESRESPTEITVEAGGDTRGLWDQRRLEQVVLNLLSNAEKYGAGRPVRVQVTGQDGVVRLSVADEGIGIAGEDQARIFGPFERAAPVDHFGGLGLGLYVARRIVEIHGGTIELTSAPGRGTTVEVLLPKGGVRTIA